MSLKQLLLALPLLAASVSAGSSETTYDINNLPATTEEGQQGYNNCGTTDSQSAMCQTAHVNSLNDFCLWAPPTPGVTIGNSEEYEVAWCTQAGHGARIIPEGTITGAHYLETPHYIQITGTGDLTNLNIAAGDEGGELDPHGATGLGNPIGSLVFHNGVQVHEWTSFMSDSEWCFRICLDASDAWLWCQHIYDIQGCQWNEPGNYNNGFDSCEGDSTEQPPGIYIVDGQSSTYQQSQGAAPTAHAAGASSNCVTVSALDVAATPKAVSTTATSSAISSSATTVESSSSVVSSSIVSSSIISSASVSSSVESSSAVSSSFISTSSFVTSTTSIVASSSIASNTSTLPSSTSTLSTTSLPVATVTSTLSASSESGSNTASAVNINAAASSSTPSSGAQRLVLSVGGSLAAVGLGLVLFA